MLVAAVRVWLAATMGAIAVIPGFLLGQTPDNAAVPEPQAIAHHQEIVDVRRILAATDPSDVDSQRKLAYAHFDLAQVRLQFGDVVEGLESAQIAFKIADDLSQAHPNDSRFQRDLKLAHEWLGNALLQANRYDEALEHHQQQLAISRRMALAEPQGARAQSDLAVANQNVAASLHNFRRNDEALQLLQSMLEINRKLATDQPDDNRLQFGLFVSYQRTALMLANLKRYTEAAESYERGLEILRTLKKANRLGLGDEKWIGVGELVIKKYHHAEIALGDWETLLAQPTDLLPLLLDLRGTQLAYDGRIADALQAAGKLRELNSVPIWPLYNATGVYCICAEAIPLVRRDATNEQLPSREECIANALATLRESFANGWDDIAHLQKDPELAVLRGLPEFQALVDELKANVKKADRDLFRIK